jgi:hypothetical protein
MQLVASVVVVLIGLLLALVLGRAGDMRAFGWVLVAVGLLGVVSRWLIARQRDDRDPPRQYR